MQLSFSETARKFRQFSVHFCILALLVVSSSLMAQRGDKGVKSVSFGIRV